MTEVTIETKCAISEIAAIVLRYKNHLCTFREAFGKLIEIDEYYVDKKGWWEYSKIEQEWYAKLLMNGERNWGVIHQKVKSKWIKREKAHNKAFKLEEV